MQILRGTQENGKDNFYERLPPIMEAIRGPEVRREQKINFVDSVLGKIHFEQNHVYDSVSRGMGYAAFYGEETVNIFQNALLREFGDRKLLYILQEKNPNVNVTKLSGMIHISSETFDAELAAIIKTEKRKVGL